MLWWILSLKLWKHEEDDFLLCDTGALEEKSEYSQ